MSWKTIVVRETDKIFLQNNQFAFLKDNKKILIPFHDIDCVILENNRTYITCYLLSKLAENNVFLLVCNAKHEPNGVFIPFSNHWKPLAVLNLQLEIGVHFKKQIWTFLIKAKIKNYLLILKKLNFNKDEIEKIKKLYRNISYNDTKNYEGVTARIFFRFLFGSNFIRHHDTGINSALNYGYKIIVSAITRTVAKYGLNDYLGVHHVGKTNPFNLSYDLIEPFRPLVDYFVSLIGETIHESLDYNHRLELIKLLQYKVMINKELRTITNTIEVMVKSFVSALKSNDSSKFLLPHFLLDENQYESNWD